MDKYNPLEKCPACGHREHDVQFMGRTTTKEIEVIDRSYLRVTCKRCKYAYNATPLYKP